MEGDGGREGIIIEKKSVQFLPSFNLSLVSLLMIYKKWVE